MQRDTPSWRQRTATGADFIHNYHPNKAGMMFSEYNIQRSLCGEVPTLRQAVEVYKKANIVTWMTTLLANLSTYMGYANMPNTTQTEGITDQFLQKYPFVRVTEVMYYFECIKDGRYYEASIKLEPQALIKGMQKYMGDLNAMKERWGNIADAYTPEDLNGVCIEILTDVGVDIASYDLKAMAMLVGKYFSSVTWERYISCKQKLNGMDDTWVIDLANYIRHPETMPPPTEKNPLPRRNVMEQMSEQVTTQYKYL